MAAKKPSSPRVTPTQKKRALGVLERLAAAMPTPVVELDFDDPWQLLVATILSAQSTDKTVNKVAPNLFARFPSPAALAAADPAEVEDLVHATGFFRNKTKSIQGMSRALVERHEGQVPRTMAEMVKLPGVARKTANVVLGKAYGLAEGVVVDVHAGRVSRRLGLTQEEDPVKVEQALMVLFPKEHWIKGGNRVVLHGRYVCTSRKPACSKCPLAELCPSTEGEPEGTWEARAAGEGRVVASRGDEKL
ncbi:MAG: endonuclease III [Myxococcales bacterium]|nr:endonuclease III [Myxococcales bacterium]